MKATIFLVLAACAASPQPLQQPVCPPAGVVMPAAVVRPAPDLDEAAVKERSHAFFDAYDRASVEEMDGMLAPSFVWYEQQRFSDRAMTLDNLKRRRDRHAPIHSRTWADERVYASGNAAVSPRPPSPSDRATAASTRWVQTSVPPVLASCMSFP